MSRVFVVTGSNKGIGKSIVKLLLQDKEEKIVYLTSRNQDLGRNAIKDLEKEGLKAKYHQLDITDKSSIEKLRDYLVEKYGGLNVLVNNAGIAYSGGGTGPLIEQAQITIGCNFHGTLDVCNVLFPILKTNGRVVNMSSTASEMAYMKFTDDVKLSYSNPAITIKELKDLIEGSIKSAAEGNLKQDEFFIFAYGLSKLAVSFMTQIHQKEMDQADKNILVNSCCPGFVSTDITGNQGGIHVDEGADTPVYLALIPVTATSLKGSYLKLKKVVPFPPQ